MIKLITSALLYSVATGNMIIKQTQGSVLCFTVIMFCFLVVVLSYLDEKFDEAIYEDEE